MAVPLKKNKKMESCMGMEFLPSKIDDDMRANIVEKKARFKSFNVK